MNEIDLQTLRISLACVVSTVRFLKKAALMGIDRKFLLVVLDSMESDLKRAGQVLGEDFMTMDYRELARICCG